MTIEPMIAGLLQMIVFLGLSEEGTVDPDAAVSQMEDLAARLQELDAEARREFVRMADVLAGEELADSGDAKRSGFIKEIPVNLGLVD